MLLAKSLLSAVYSPSSSGMHPRHGPCGGIGGGSGNSGTGGIGPGQGIDGTWGCGGIQYGGQGIPGVWGGDVIGPGIGVGVG